MRAYFVFDLFAHILTVVWYSGQIHVLLPHSQLYGYKFIQKLYINFSGTWAIRLFFFLMYKLLLHCILGLRITFSLLLILKTFCYMIILQKIFFSILTPFLQFPLIVSRLFYYYLKSAYSGCLMKSKATRNKSLLFFKHWLYL